jgi:integrase
MTLRLDLGTFLLSDDGKAFANRALSNWFSRAAREAGLPVGRTMHGLRKAALRRLAEAGCSANEMQAISGHGSLANLQIYVEAANKAKLAKQALARLAAAGNSAAESAS